MFVICTVNVLLCYSYFSLLLVQNKPSNEDSKQAFILVPVTLVVNNNVTALFREHGHHPLPHNTSFWHSVHQHLTIPLLLVHQTLAHSSL
jgi:hypothetical protein